MNNIDIDVCILLGESHSLSGSRYSWSCHLNVWQYALYFTVVKNSALKLHVVIVQYPNFILGGVFILPFSPLMKTGGRKWRWTLGLALRTTTFSSCSKSYHHLQAVYYFLAPHLLLSVTQFRAVEGNGNYATCILNFSGQILFATIFWLLCIKLL